LLALTPALDLGRAESLTKRRKSYKKTEVLRHHQVQAIRLTLGVTRRPERAVGCKPHLSVDTPWRGGNLRKSWASQRKIWGTTT